MENGERKEGKGACGQLGILSRLEGRVGWMEEGVQRRDGGSWRRTDASWDICYLQTNA